MWMCYSKGTFLLCVFCLFSVRRRRGEGERKKDGWQWWWQRPYVARKSTGHGRWR